MQLTSLIVFIGIQGLWAASSESSRDLSYRPLEHSARRILGVFDAREPSEDSLRSSLSDFNEHFDLVIASVVADSRSSYLYDFRESLRKVVGWRGYVEFVLNELCLEDDLVRKFLRKFLLGIVISSRDLEQQARRIIEGGSSDPSAHVIFKRKRLPPLPEEVEALLREVSVSHNQSESISSDKEIVEEAVAFTLPKRGIRRKRDGRDFIEFPVEERTHRPPHVVAVPASSQPTDEQPVISPAETAAVLTNETAAVTEQEPSRIDWPRVTTPALNTEDVSLLIHSRKRKEVLEQLRRLKRRRRGNAAH